MISIVDDLILFNYIDSGCFAEIYLSKKQDSNILLATKKISLKYISVEPLFKTSLQNEINFLKELNHPNIIKLYEVKIKPDYIYLIMEYCNGGSLKKALNNYKAKYGKHFSEEIPLCGTNDKGNIRIFVTKNRIFRIWARKILFFFQKVLTISFHSIVTLHREPTVCREARQDFSQQRMFHQYKISHHINPPRTPHK